MIRTIPTSAWAAAVCAWALGCSSAKKAEDAAFDETRTTLEDVRLLLQAPSYDGQPPPRKADDLRKFENAFPTGFAAVQSGEVVVVWGARMPPEGEGGSDAIIAYEKKTPAQGGLVLLENGTIKPMTPDQFNSAPKAH